MKMLNVLSISALNKEIEKYLENTMNVIECDLDNSLNYVLAKDIYAIENTPQFMKSTVDGYATNSKDCVGASQSIPSILKDVGSVSIGLENDITLNKNECTYINTGAMLPKNADSVVMIENTDYMINSNEVLVFNKVASLENVTTPGFDIKEKQLLFTKNQVIDERIQGVLASQGITKVMVYKKLDVLVLSSGNELVNYNDDIKLGQVRDINTIMLVNLLKKTGFNVTCTYLIEDNYDKYLEILQNNKADIYITSGGSSQGDEDFTYDVFNEITNNVFCHGLAIKPGKPTIAALKDCKLYLGLPGNPVSAYLVLFQTLINTYKKINNSQYYHVRARLAVNVASSAGKDSIVLVELKYENNQYVAYPLYYRSSNVLVLSKANGYFIINSSLEGLEKDEIVEVNLF